MRPAFESLTAHKIRSATRHNDSDEGNYFRGCGKISEEGKHRRYNSRPKDTIYTPKDATKCFLPKSTLPTTKTTYIINYRPCYYWESMHAPYAPFLYIQKNAHRSNSNTTTSHYTSAHIRLARPSIRVKRTSFDEVSRKPPGLSSS